MSNLTALAYSQLIDKKKKQAYQKNYYELHKEELRQKHKKYYLENKEHLKKVSRERYLKAKAGI